MSNIMKTQNSFTIYKEGNPDRLANLSLKLERLAYTKLVPALDKVDHYFTHHTLSDYQPPVEARPTRNAHGQFVSQS